MTRRLLGDQIIATDYFDGPLEGFARIGHACFYFCKEADNDDLGEYTYTLMENSLFDELKQAVNATSPASGVFVYSGSNEVAIRLVDDALATLRAKAKHEGKRVVGYDFFEAMQPK